MDFMRMMEAAMEGKMRDPWAPYADAETMMGNVLGGPILNDLGDFREGDFITAKKGSNNKGRGLPMLVLKKYEPVAFPAERGTAISYHDMIVRVRFADGDMQDFPELSSGYEKFDPAKVEL